MKITALDDCEILVCVGSGGVGKTTLAASLAVMAAQSGLKTLVLTIDPSKRLAQALGIEGQKEITLVPGQNFKGTLSASIVDHKTVFDDFIKRASQKEESVARILKNKLYIQLSTTLSGSQEFTALEKLYQAYESKQFDLIILDTPPAQHAIEFLQAPQKLAALFNEGVAQWFRNPKAKNVGFFRNILSAGTRQVLKALEVLTGAEFIQELADFFSLIENWQNKLHDRTVLFHKMLVHSKTKFALVTSFEEAKLSEAQVFSREIQKSGYHLKYIFLNRAFPSWTFEESNSLDLKPEITRELKRLSIEWENFYYTRRKLFEKFQAQISNDIQVEKVLEFTQPIANLKGLEKLAERIQEGG